MMSMTYIQYTVLLLLLLCSWTAKSVEFSEQQYQQTIADIQKIYALPQHNAADLQSLREEVMEGVNHYFPPGENQGVLSIKTPVKANHITIVQIPHAFFDLHSLDIGQQMFDTQWADVLMINTEHRYETEKSDLARLRYSLFTATVDALRKLGTQVNVIQVHGYNEKKRKTASAQQTDLILSNGSAVPDTYMLQVQSCLRDNSQLLARLYGRDVFELGATVNPVGKLLRRHKNHDIHFLHIELPRRLREQMVSNMSSQDTRQVLKCLLDY